MPYSLAVFDLDGTILDTLEDLCDSVNFSLERFHMPKRSLDEIRCFVGNGIRKLVLLAVPENTDPDTADAVFECFREHYLKFAAVKTKPYPKIPEVLKELKRMQIRTAVFSNKADAVVQNLCSFYFPGLFDTCRGEREGFRRQPFPDVIYDLQKTFSVSKKEILYIGDSDVDEMTARNAGVDLLLVDWGFRDRDTLLSLHTGKVIHRPEDILLEFR